MNWIRAIDFTGRASPSEFAFIYILGHAVCWTSFVIWLGMLQHARPRPRGDLQQMVGRRLATLLPVILLSMLALGCGAGDTTSQSPNMGATVDALATEAASVPVEPTPTPTVFGGSHATAFPRTATVTPTPGPGPAQTYMAEACHALGEMPDVWDEKIFEEAFPLLTALTPPDELQEYHTTLIELLEYGAQAPEQTADRSIERELVSRLVAHVTAAQALDPALLAAIRTECPPDYVDSLDDDELLYWAKELAATLEPPDPDRLTREEYLEVCPDFLGFYLEFDEPPPYDYDALIAAADDLVREASLVVPPVELADYHALVVGWLIVSAEGIRASQLQEQNPDDPETRGRIASVYLQFRDLGLALSPTLREMDPSLREALDERGCLIEESAADTGGAQETP